MPRMTKEELAEIRKRDEWSAGRIYKPNPPDMIKSQAEVDRTALLSELAAVEAEREEARGELHRRDLMSGMTGEQIARADEYYERQSENKSDLDGFNQAIDSIKNTPSADKKIIQLTAELAAVTEERNEAIQQAGTSIEIVRRGIEARLHCGECKRATEERDKAVKALPNRDIVSALRACVIACPEKSARDLLCSALDAIDTARETSNKELVPILVSLETGKKSSKLARSEDEIRAMYERVERAQEREDSECLEGAIEVFEWLFGNDDYEPDAGIEEDYE